MSTLAEIEDAVMSLPPEEQQALLDLLSSRLRRAVPETSRRPLKAASYPPLKGLPPDLSVRVKEQMRELVAKRHAADR
jgi:hypothetical protein